MDPNAEDGRRRYRTLNKKRDFNRADDKSAKQNNTNSGKAKLKPKLETLEMTMMTMNMILCRHERNCEIQT